MMRTKKRGKLKTRNSQGRPRKSPRVKPRDPVEEQVKDVKQKMSAKMKSDEVCEINRDQMVLKKRSKNNWYVNFLKLGSS